MILIVYRVVQNIVATFVHSLFTCEEEAFMTRYGCVGPRHSFSRFSQSLMW